eukprot:TRINITY_DN3602_c0_g1_i2.p1 TRINITY_DN3602_c0_g1~~TRINITY_DN3602_c0_g1_i2.p1  ORF type:complete len:102 (-),score=18.56 TRINITY_DN3602_c0_g1_i2:18-323(-)
MTKEERQAKIDTLCYQRLERAADRECRRWKKKYGVLTYKIGEMVRVRPRDWRTRNKCEKMWKWRATIINLTETTVGLEWIGDPTEDLEPLTQGWAIHNIAT